MKREEILKVLFCGISQDSEMIQGEESWLIERKKKLTSSDVVPIVLYNNFKEKDPFVDISELYFLKTNDVKVDTFRKNKFKQGHLFEGNVLHQMSSSSKFEVVSKSPILICDKFIVSIDGICLLKRDSINGIAHYTVYEIKFTTSERVFSAIKNSDMTSVYHKKYSLQLAFHMLATHYYLESSLGYEFKLDGVIICGMSDNAGKTIYARSYIESIDNIFCNAILNQYKELLRAHECIFNKHEEPFPKILSSNKADNGLAEMIDDYVKLSDQLDCIESKMEVLHDIIISKMVESGVIAHQLNTDRSVVLFESNRTKSELINDNYETRNEILSLKQKIESFYNKTVEKKIVLKIKNKKGDKSW
ncbi:MAG: YqaJ viral recombinase family protein [Paraclostridium sp.]